MLGSWRWSRQLLAAVPAHRETIRINMDETSVSFFYGHGKGNMVVSRRPVRSSDLPVQAADKKALRGAMTHVAFLCDSHKFQPHMPQIIVCAASLVTVAETRAIRATLPFNVYFLRRKSGWLNANLLNDIVELLNEILKDWKSEYYFVFGMDTAPQHIKPETLQLLHSLEIPFFFYAAQLTWLLQSLDTHVFVHYKRKLKELFQDFRVDDSLEVRVRDLVGMVCVVVEQVLEGRCWQHAFDQNGFGMDQISVSTFIRRQCQFDALPDVPGGLPALDDLRPVFPSNYTMPTTLRDLLPSSLLPPPLPPPAFPPVVPLRRLCSKTRQEDIEDMALHQLEHGLVGSSHLQPSASGATSSTSAFQAQ